MNRRRWMRTRKRLDHRVIDQVVRQFSRDVEKAYFFGDGGPEHFVPSEDELVEDGPVYIRRIVGPTGVEF